MAEGEIHSTVIDPESEFLASKRTTGHEWEIFKENVRPLKRGRNVNLLNHALNSHSHAHLKKSLLQHRRFILSLSLFFVLFPISSSSHFVFLPTENSSKPSKNTRATTLSSPGYSQYLHPSSFSVNLFFLLPQKNLLIIS